MKTKPYPQKEEKTMVASEPAVSYGGMAMAGIDTYQPTSYQLEILRRSEEDSKTGRVYTQEEVDKMLERWLN